MSKEYLEALNIIKFNPDDVDALQYLEAFKVVEKALQRLEAIDNAKPSEALGLIKRTCELYIDSMKQRDLIGYDIIEKQINEALDTIKQALETKSKKELAFEIIVNKQIDMQDLMDTTDDYRLYVAYCKGKGYEDDFILTQEEFDTLKEVLSCQKN